MTAGTYTYDSLTRLDLTMGFAALLLAIVCRLIAGLYPTWRVCRVRRSDIIRYFMTENWLLTSGGTALGSVLALGCGHWLSKMYSLPRLQLP